MTDDEKAALDGEWSRRVAAIAVATISVAKPKLPFLTPEEVSLCTEIVAEEILSA